MTSMTGDRGIITVYTESFRTRSGRPRPATGTLAYFDINYFLIYILILLLIINRGRTEDFPTPIIA